VSLSCSIMAEQTKEQLMLWRAAVRAIGRALRQEYEPKQEQTSDHLRQLLSKLDSKRKHNKEE
jgi:hypothetical protein